MPDIVNEINLYTPSKKQAGGGGGWISLISKKSVSRVRLGLKTSQSTSSSYLTIQSSLK